MDGLTLAASAWECRALLGGRIDKIYQPEKDELLLFLRAPGGNYKLLLSASPNNCRVQLTGVVKQNPDQPPMFCMLLRKHLIGGRITAITQPGLDRVLHISITASDALGDPAEYTLIAEIMGKHSNIVLISGGVVLDAIRHVSFSVSSVRQLVPGAKYVPPPAQAKADPRETSEAGFFSVLLGEGRIEAALSGAFGGLSPKVAAALAGKVSDKTRLEQLSENEAHSLARFLAGFYAQAASGVFRPTLMLNEYGEALGVLPFEPDAPRERLRSYASLCEALDEYYALRDREESLKRRSGSIGRVLQNNIERCEKKLRMQQDTLASAHELETLRQNGELLLANAHALQKSSLAVVDNFFADPPQRVEIPLDKTLSISENAQRFFKKYQKLKAALEMSQKQREATLAELAYLEGAQGDLSKCTEEADLLELRAELEREGYLRPQRRSKQKPQKSRPMHFVSDDGTDIFVGKNNAQNDQLTFRVASGDDIWLHAKDMPGSHVIIKCGGGEPSRTALEQAALLAAHYSKGRDASVPVDYTLRKHVKKPSGARAGFVVYETNKTLLITPSEPLIKRIQRIE